MARRFILSEPRSGGQIIIKTIELQPDWRLPKSSGQEENTTAFLVSPHSGSQIIKVE